jgi:hypothetical protein
MTPAGARAGGIRGQIKQTPALKKPRGNLSRPAETRRADIRLPSMPTKAHAVKLMQR